MYKLAQVSTEFRTVPSMRTPQVSRNTFHKFYKGPWGSIGCRGVQGSAKFSESSAKDSFFFCILKKKSAVRFIEVPPGTVRFSDAHKHSVGPSAVPWDFERLIQVLHSSPNPSGRSERLCRFFKLLFLFEKKSWNMFRKTLNVLKRSQNILEGQRRLHPLV